MNTRSALGSGASSDSSTRQFIGRRTGKVFEIKTYDDLFSESETDASLDVTRTPNVKEITERAPPKPKSNKIVSPSTKDTSFSKPLSVKKKAPVSKKNVRSRIGRRTGKDLLAGKKNLQDADRIGNFSDLFSDADESISLHPTPERTISSAPVTTLTEVRVDPDTSQQQPRLDFGGTAVGSVSTADKVLPGEFFGIKKRLTFSKRASDSRISMELESKDLLARQRKSHPGSFLEHHSKDKSESALVELFSNENRTTDPDTNTDSSDGFRIINCDASPQKSSFITFTGRRRSSSSGKESWKRKLEDVEKKDDKADSAAAGVKTGECLGENTVSDDSAGKDDVKVYAVESKIPVRRRRSSRKSQNKTDASVVEDEAVDENLERDEPHIKSPHYNAEMVRSHTSMKREKGLEKRNVVSRKRSQREALDSSGEKGDLSGYSATGEKEEDGTSSQDQSPMKISRKDGGKQKAVKKVSSRKRSNLSALMDKSKEKGSDYDSPPLLIHATSARSNLPTLIDSSGKIEKDRSSNGPRLLMQTSPIRSNLSASIASNDNNKKDRSSNGPRLSIQTSPIRSNLPAPIDSSGKIEKDRSSNGPRLSIQTSPIRSNLSAPIDSSDDEKANDRGSSDSCLSIQPLPIRSNLSTPIVSNDKNEEDRGSNGPRLSIQTSPIRSNLSASIASNDNNKKDRSSNDPRLSIQISPVRSNLSTPIVSNNKNLKGRGRNGPCLSIQTSAVGSKLSASIDSSNKKKGKGDDGRHLSKQTSPVRRGKKLKVVAKARRSTRGSTNGRRTRSKKTLTPRSPNVRLQPMAMLARVTPKSGVSFRRKSSFIPSRRVSTEDQESHQEEVDVSTLTTPKRASSSRPKSHNQSKRAILKASSCTDVESDPSPIDEVDEATLTTPKRTSSSRVKSHNQSMRAILKASSCTDVESDLSPIDNMEHTHEESSPESESDLTIVDSPENQQAAGTKGSRKKVSLRKRAILESARVKGLRAVVGSSLPSPTARSAFQHHALDESMDLPSPSSTPIHYAETTMSNKRRSSIAGDVVLPDLSYKIIRPEKGSSGLRRSKRTRVQRLQGHKGEGIVYRRDSAGYLMVDSIMPSLGEAKLLAMERKRSKRKMRRKLKANAVPAKARRMSHHVPVDRDDLTNNTDISVINPDTQERVFVELVSHSEGAKWVGPDLSALTSRDTFGVSVLLNQPSFSSGQLHIRPLCEKPQQLTMETMVYFLICGKVCVTVNNSSFIVENRDDFFIPRGSSYKIKNLRRDIAQLKFLNINDSSSTPSAANTPLQQ